MTLENELSIIRVVNTFEIPMKRADLTTLFERGGGASRQIRVSFDFFYSELYSVSTRSTLILCPPLKNNDTDKSCYEIVPLPIPFRLRYLSSRYDHPMVRKTCFSDDGSKMKIRFGCESVFQCVKLPAKPVRYSSPSC